MATRTVTETLNQQGSVLELKLACITNSSDGLFADYTIQTKIEGSPAQLITNPGTPAPDPNYDITIKNQHGVDILLGVGANRHTSTSEIAAVVFSGTSANPLIKSSDVLTLGISGSTANSAATDVVLYLRRT